MWAAGAPRNESERLAALAIAEAEARNWYDAWGAAGRYESPVFEGVVAGELPHANQLLRRLLTLSMHQRAALADALLRAPWPVEKAARICPVFRHIVEAP